MGSRQRFILAAIGIVATVPCAAAAATPSPGHLEAERVRLTHHFDAVLAELHAADASHLSAEQRALREGHLAVLAAYRDAGRFPINRDFPDRPMPYFRDADGTLCAMAHLIAKGGGEAVVERIAATRNNAFIPELADDPAIVTWLEANGLSEAEAARIQPTYRPRYTTRAYCICEVGFALPLAEGRVVGHEEVEKTWTDGDETKVSHDDAAVVEVLALHPSDEPLTYRWRFTGPHYEVIEAAEGDRMHVRGAYEQTYPVGTTALLADGWDGFGFWWVLDEDRLIHCDLDGAERLSVSPAVAAEALASEDCHGRLEEEDRAWGAGVRCDGSVWFPPSGCKRWRLGGCGVAPGAGGAAPAWAVLLAFAFLAARRRGGGHAA